MEPPMVRRRPIVIISILFLLLFISSEIYLRHAGFASYPVYDVDAQIKYIPAANQHGRFLNHNAWFFNDRHMGNISNWSTGNHPNILLIGNSIVLGGNPFDHQDKLGPLLEKDLGGRYTVWSAAAGGWSNINEMTYLDRNADVVQNADAVILEYMNGGLSAPNDWPGYYVFPDQKPWSVTFYTFRKYVLPRLAHAAASDFGALPPTGMFDDAQLRRFDALVASVAKAHKVLIFMYPAAKDLQNKAAWLEATAPILELCKTTSAICLDLAQQPAWNETAYGSDGVHPTVDGNKILASILANAID
jgi:hypothetical protein